MRSVEKRYQECLAELETNLSSARDRVLQLHDEKVKVEKDLSTATQSLKDALAATQIKDIKLSEMSIRVHEYEESVAS